MPALYALPDFRRNSLLASLSAEDYCLLGRQMKLVEIGCGQVIALSGQAADAVYFPCSGVFVNLIRMQDGRASGAGIIGSEGIIGAHSFLTADAAHEAVTCILPGIAAKMRYDAFQTVTRENVHLHGLVQRYAAALLNMAEQTAACNQLHPAKGRLARWLLMIHDRAGVDQFSILHQRLADLLGLQRPSISLAAEGLQKEGAIKYRRGRMTILDRNALEGSACECYQVVRHAFLAFFPECSMHAIDAMAEKPVIHSP